MIMRPGQQLLLPAKPLFIWGSVVAAVLAIQEQPTLEAAVALVIPYQAAQA